MSDDIRYTRDGVLELIERERARLLALVARSEAEAAGRGITDEGWSAKDVLAHCIHWAGQLAFGMGARMQPPPWVLAAGDQRPGGDEWNRRVVEHYRDSPLETVTADFDRVTAAVIDRVRRCSDEEINGTGALPWAPADEPLWKSIASEAFAHWPEHSTQIENASARGA